MVGEDYEVKDIFEQEPIYQKVVKVERLGSLCYTFLYYLYCNIQCDGFVILIDNG